MIAENLGGSGYHSKMNTRVIYVPVATEKTRDNPLNLSGFQDFQSYFIDHLQNKILRNEPVSTTGMRCDSCVTIEGKPVFVHEAKSESMEFEEKKSIFQMARCLPYVSRPYSMITDRQYCYLGSLRLNEASKELEYSKCMFEYCPPDQVGDKAEAVESLIKMVKTVARVLKTFVPSINAIGMRMAGTKLDDPQMRSPEFQQQNVGRYEGIFCMDGSLSNFLPQNYVKEVFDRMQQDSAAGVVLKVIGKAPIAHRTKVV